jgi:hypothetical protein
LWTQISLGNARLIRLLGQYTFAKATAASFLAIPTTLEYYEQHFSTDASSPE